MCIYLNRSTYPRDCCEESDWFRIQTSKIKSHQFKNIRPTTWAFVWRGWQRYTCVCHYLWQEWLFQLYTFVFLCRTNTWVKYPWNSIFFKFERMLHWYEIKAYMFKNLFFSEISANFNQLLKENSEEIGEKLWNSKKKFV